MLNLAINIKIFCQLAAISVKHLHFEIDERLEIYDQNYSETKTIAVQKSRKILKIPKIRILDQNTLVGFPVVYLNIIWVFVQTTKM